MGGNESLAISLQTPMGTSSQPTTPLQEAVIIPEVEFVNLRVAGIEASDFKNERAHKGDRVLVLTTADNFAHIQLASGAKGYIKTKYLSMTRAHGFRQVSVPTPLVSSQLGTPAQVFKQMSVPPQAATTTSQMFPTSSSRPVAPGHVYRQVSVPIRSTAMASQISPRINFTQPGALEQVRSTVQTSAQTGFNLPATLEQPHGKVPVSSTFT